MATEDPHAPGVSSTPPQHQPAAAPTAKRPRWARMLAIILAVPVVIFVYFFIVGPPKPKPTDATSVLRALAKDPTFASKAGIEGNFVETSPIPGPMGLQGEFLWSRAGEPDAEIYTFEGPMSTTGIFEKLKEPGSLLVPGSDSDARYTSFYSDANSPAEKRYDCAETTKGFACGSISAGLPVIVILRRPLESEPQRYNPSDPMSAFRKMDQYKARTNAIGNRMVEIDAVLQRLGITMPPREF